MKNKIIIVTDEHFFGQSYNTWKSINIELFIRYLKKNSHFEVKEILISNAINENLDLEDCYVLYTASVDPVTLEYIKDVVWTLNDKNKMIPSFEQLLCLENKGFQEVYKKAYNIAGLKANYYNSVNNIDLSSIEYPVVFKKTDGAGSKYVALIKKKDDLLKVYKKMKGRRYFLRYYLLIARKYFLLDSIDFAEYKKYHYPKMNFILQEFIPNLKCDYKAIVFFDKIYLLKRIIRKKDFRASGSGDFLFISDASDRMIDYIYDVYQSLNCPFVSLDVAKNNNSYDLIEFQFSHFGPYTLQKSNGFFSKENNWKYVPEKSILELEMVKSYISYISTIK